MPASSPHLASVVPSWLWGGGGAVAAEEEEGRWRRRRRGERVGAEGWWPDLSARAA